jgi:hypothetical protein
MEQLPDIDLPLAASALVALLLLVALFYLWRWERRRRQRAAIVQAVTRCGFEHLRNVLLPDSQGGALHLDFLLLTARGLIVIDLRNVVGNIFGGDQMSAWTVMQRSLRYTFDNPQTGLYDRIAAVRALAQGVPVDGRIVFTGRGHFPKGLPRHTLMLESMAAEFPVSDRETMRSLLERWMPAWNAIRQASSPSRLAGARAAL